MNEFKLLLLSSLVFTFGAMGSYIFADIYSQLTSFLIYAFFSCLLIRSSVNKISLYFRDEGSKFIYDRPLYVVMFAIIIVSTLLIVFTKGFSLSSFFHRSRDFREELFSTGPTLGITYFLLFSSSYLFFFLGAASACVGNRKIILLGIITAFIGDGVTDSRSSVLALVLGLMTVYFVFARLNFKLIKIIVLSLIVIYYGLMVGQGGEDGVFFLRVISYFAAPILLSHEIYADDSSSFVGSVFEFLFWPLLSLTGIQLFDTTYEYRFYSVANGLQMNVLIPSYSVFNKFTDSVIFVFVALALRIILTKQLVWKRTFDSKSSSPMMDLALITLFGPMSLMINPLLAEKALWLFLMIVIFVEKFKMRSRIALHVTCTLREGLHKSAKAELMR